MMEKISLNRQILSNNNFQLFKQIYLSHRLQVHKCSTKVQTKIKPIVILDENIDKLIKEEQIKPRKHEGVIHRATIQLPNWIINAMKNIVGERPRNIIFNDARNLYRFLNSKLPPSETKHTESKNKKIEEIIEKGTDDEAIKLKNDIILSQTHDKTMRTITQKNSSSAPIQYDKQKSLMYMLARGAQDYAILYKILKEIKSRDEHFKPKTLLDFGSGIGTVSWVATEFWNGSLRERVCVDISTEINEIAEELIKSAEPKVKSKGFHRQYLPIAPVLTFDLVVSSLSLLELPNRKMRMNTLSNLWRNTEKYLVLIEYGTKGGFEIISEAREFIRHLINVQKERDPQCKGFVFSPCPHDSDCPQLLDKEKKCTFQTKFFELTFDTQLNARTESYSYVVFKKGADREEKDHWPRIIRPVIVRSGHSICRMCTSAGKLQEIIFSKGKHDRSLYYCARNSRWGDRMPIEIDMNKEG